MKFLIGGFLAKKIGKAVQKKVLGFDPAKKIGKMRNVESRGVNANARDTKDFEAQKTASVDYNLPVRNSAQDRIVNTRNTQPTVDPNMGQIGMRNSTIEVFNRNNPENNNV